MFIGSLEVQLAASSRESLQKSIEVLSEELFDDSTGRSTDVTLLADCHFKMAQFCYDQLEVEVLGEVSTTIVKYLFSTTRYIYYDALVVIIQQNIVVLYVC